MATVVLYSATGCPLCAKYRMLLTEKNVSYVEKNTTEQPGYLKELHDKGILMVPTVFVGDKHVAGFRPSSLLQLLAA